MCATSINQKENSGVYIIRKFS